ncbi:MAG: FAD-dependent oxidoreductase [Pseudomonadota bacterium]
MNPINPAAWRAFAAAIGKDHVLTSEEDRSDYADHFAADETKHEPAGALAPANAEEVREVVRIANQYRVPLWPISRGKNFGYGGSAPVMRGAVVLDLSRMKKIEVDAETGTVLVEPGVGFFDLYDHLQSKGIPLWLSVPGNSSTGAWAIPPMAITPRASAALK